MLVWLQDVSDADLHLASVTIGEIQACIELTREQDPAKAAEIEQWLVQVTCTYNILAMDGAAFRCWARLMHRQSDALDEDARFGVELINPFTLGAVRPELRRKTFWPKRRPARGHTKPDVAYSEKSATRVAACH